MKNKSVLPFAAVLAIAAVWSIFTRGGKNPLTMNMDPLGKSSTQTTVTVTSPVNQNRSEDRIATLFQNEEALASSIQVHAVHCEESVCTVEAFASEDPSVVRMKIEELVQANPWLGPWELKKEAENPGIFSLIFYSENP
jgi:hypothetical protein